MEYLTMLTIRCSLTKRPITGALEYVTRHRVFHFRSLWISPGRRLLTHEPHRIILALLILYVHLAA